MRKAALLLSVIFLSFISILQSSALVIPYTPSDNEKAIYAK
jgi:hypothetical protein